MPILPYCLQLEEKLSSFEKSTSLGGAQKDKPSCGRDLWGHSPRCLCHRYEVLMVEQSILISIFD
jgi:hypothetical protein